MAANTGERPFYRRFDLRAERETPPKKQPAAHQSDALTALTTWYKGKHTPAAGSLLVLPTGAGKTFTALRFLSRGPLSDGYKVLWLAHTHHLLEQVFYAVPENVGLIHEPRRTLAVRVVSGTPGHGKVRSIQYDDDMLIATLQTVVRATRANHPALEKFLQSARGRLFVVFDEAHHAPAPSYRRLMLALRRDLPQCFMLGLTATPTYTAESQRGWLTEIFPQGICYQVTPQRLMAEGILARPIIEETRTGLDTEFDERLYQEWSGSFGDLPQEIITNLAENRERNAMIADHYVEHQKRYGRTMIFVDRWFQCVAIQERLESAGVRAGSMYSHVDAQLRTVAERNQRTRDENAVVLQMFRDGDLDVVLNIRMLTEGTDIPEARSVFLTRQTTSRILLTQMVGRVLRGPRFGGKDTAYIVSFIDEWKHLIQWAEADQIVGGMGEAPPTGERLPTVLISIELVRELARLMDRGLSRTEVPFLTLLPVGWYHVTFLAAVEGTDDTEEVHHLVLVFDNEVEGFQRFIERVAGATVKEREPLALEHVNTERALATVQGWKERVFTHEHERFGGNLDHDLVEVARHIAQNGVAPQFFPFEARGRHDLDALARESIKTEMTRKAEDDALRFEYNRRDRYWQVLYPRYDLLKAHYNACAERILAADELPPPLRPEAIQLSSTDREPSEDVKSQVKARDGYACVCCGCSYKPVLQVDHITSWYLGGGNGLDNLQTLCKTCNRHKGTRTLNFLDPLTDLPGPVEEMEVFEHPEGRAASDRYQWEQFLRRTINFFYRCGAVHAVLIGRRGTGLLHWEVELGLETTRPGCSLTSRVCWPGSARHATKGDSRRRCR